MGIGYNPFRKANGEFAAKDEAGAKAERDLAEAYEHNDEELAAEIEDVIIDKFPELPRAQTILRERYMDKSMGGFYATPEEAQKAFEEKVNAEYQEKLARRAKYPLTPQEKALRRQNYDAAQELVEARAETGDVIYDDANLKRAERRLNEAIEYAKGRENIYLVDKLSRATVLPSGAFLTADKKRINTDAVLKSYVATKAIEKARNKAIAELTTRLGDEKVGTKFSVKTAAGSFSLTVAEGIDDEAYDALPEDVRISISSEKDGFDSALAREHLSPEKYKAITNETQVIDYVVGKAPDSVVPEFKFSEKAGVQGGLEDIAAFYGETHKTVGKVRELKATLAEGSGAIKAEAAKREGNTFAPARSQFNGAVVSGRRNVDPKKVDELLTVEEKALISKKNLSPDLDKAKNVLSPEEFGRIFETRKLALRVTESK